MVGSSGLRGRSAWLACALGLGVLSASPASAEWRLYAGADLGYSVGDSDASGSGDFFLTGTTTKLRGGDDDTSPLVGGTLGIAVPIDELAAWELPRGWRLPHWDVRAEVEGVGLREYDLRTDPISGGAQSDNFHARIKMWTVMGNVWLDVPLRGLYRPISWTSARLFGRWRLRPLKTFLDRTTFDMGAGVGVASLDMRTTDGNVRGSNETLNFAWQAGGNLSYHLTDSLILSTGYRYLDPGDVKTSLGAQSDHYKLDTDIHEFRAGIRVEYFGFAMPWR